MEINLNGNKIKSHSRTIMDLVSDQDLDPKSLIVELNLKIIKQENWEKTELKQGDNIELLGFVQGG